MPGDAICITTNGFVKKNGEAVMGRGIAKEAANSFPEFPRILGDSIFRNGNHLNVFFEMIHHYNGDTGEEYSQDIVTFPVKHNWFEKADMELIRRSARELMKWADQLPHWERVLLPRPGCGNGKLDWSDVKREIEPILDDRISVVTFSKS
jgi:hypothetical protein